MASAAILISLPAYAETTMTVLNSSGSVVNIPAETSTVGGVSSVTLHSVPEVSGSAVTSGNPLPTADSAAEGSLATIATQTSGVATAAKQATINADGGSQVHVQNFPSTQAVTVSGTPTVAVTTLPALPNGTNAIGSVTVTNTPNVAVTSLPALPNGTNTIGNVNINGTPSVSISGTVPVSGSVALMGTPSVSVTSTVLPTGAATNANQGTVNTVGTNTTSGNLQVIQGATGGVPLPVSGAITATPSSVSYGLISCTTTASTSTQCMAGGSFPHGGDILNPATATANLCFNFGSAASASSPCLAPGTAYHLPFPTVQALNVYATAAQTVEGFAY